MTKVLLLQRTGGACAQCQSHGKILPLHQECRHTYYHTSTSINVFCYQKWVLWIAPLLLGWTGSIWQLEFGVKQYCSWLNLKYSIDTYESDFQTYVPWIENHRHNTAQSHLPPHSWALFCTFLLAKKKQGNAKESTITAKQRWPKPVLLGRGAKGLTSVICGSIWVRMQKKTDTF